MVEALFYLFFMVAIKAARGRLMHFLHVLDKGINLCGMGSVLEEQISLNHNDFVQQGFSQKPHFMEGDDSFEFVSYRID
jgi:hypothetical protein